MKRLLLILTIFLSFTINDKAADLETVSPGFGDSLAPNSPIIILSSDKRIHFPDLFRTSPIDSNNSYVRPQIYLIKTAAYDSISNNFHHAFAEKIIIDTLNYKTLSLFTLGALMNDVSYTLVIDSLPVKDLADFNVTYIDTVYYDYFRVLPDLPKVIGFSPVLTNNYINCEDTITFNFSGPIDTSLVSIDSLFGFSSHEGISYDTLAIDSIMITNEFNNETFNFDISDNKREIKFYKSSKMLTGKSFFVSYDATKFGLDSIYNFYGTFSILESSYIRVYSKHQDSTITIPDSLQPSIGNNFFNLTSSDTIEVEVNDDNKYMEFSHWESKITHINNNTNKRISIYNNCENFSISDIVAVFIKPCIDTIQITWDVQDSVDEVKLIGFLDSLGNNKYTISKKDSNSLKLFVKPKPGYVYDNCVLHDSIFVSNVIENVIDLDFNFYKVPCDTLFIVEINTLPLAACTKFNVCVSISDFKGIIGFPIDQIVSVNNVTSWNTPTTDDHKTGCIELSIPPDKQTFSLDVDIISQYSSCYEISGIWTSFGDKIEYSENQQGVETFDMDFELDKDKSCNLMIHIQIRPKNYILEVHHVLKDERVLPKEVNLNFGNIKNDGNGTYMEFKLVYHEITGDLIDFIEYYKYPCNTTAEFFPKIYKENESLFTLSKWKCPSDFTPTDNSVVCSSVSPSPYEDYLTFTMDDNYKIYYEYERAPFYAKSITVFEENDTDTKTYKFRGTEIAEDEKPLFAINSGMPVVIYGINNQDSYPVSQTLPRPSTDNGLYELNRNYHKKTAKVIIEFSHPVNINSLVSNKNVGYGGMYSVDSDGFKIGDTFLRRDAVLAQTYDGEINGLRGGSISLIQSHLVEFIFATQSNHSWYNGKFFYAPHMSKLDFYLGPDISRLVDGEKLANPLQDGPITIQTRNPGIYIGYDSYSRYEYYDIFKGFLGDNCSFSNKPDVFYHFYSTIAENTLSSDDLNEIIDLGKAGKSSSVIDNVANNTVRTMNQVLLQSSRINRNGYPILGILLMDEGNTLSAYNMTAITGGKLADAITKAVTTDDKSEVRENATEKLKPENKQAPFLPGDLIGYGLSALFTLGDCSDIPIGVHNFVGNPINNWSPIKGSMHLLYSGGGLSGDDKRLSDPVYHNWYYRSIIVDRGVRMGSRIYWILGDF